MCFKRIFIIGFVLMFLGQEAKSQALSAESFKLETRKNRSARMNFELFNNLVVIPVIVNQSKDTLKLVLDTGVANTLITGLPNGEEISLNYVNTIKIAGLGEGASIDAFYSTGNEVIIDQTTGENQVILVLKEDVFNLSTLLGTYVHGLIGYSLFKDFIVEIDYRKRWLKFHDPTKFAKNYESKKRSNKWSSIPLTFKNDKPYIDVDIIQKDGSSLRVNLLIDSGSSSALSLYHSANEKIIIPERTIRSFLGNGLSGEIEGYLGRIEQLKIGDYVLNNPISAYPDEEDIQRAILVSSRDGSIGADALKRFKVFFNYQDSTMLIQPSKFYKDIFSYNMSGIEIATPFPNIPLYEISHIREGSIADREGLKPGDYITEINGKGSSNYTLNEAVNLFQKNPGEYLRLKVVRNDSTFRRELLLIDEID